MVLGTVGPMRAGQTTRLAQLSFGRMSNDGQTVSAAHSAMWKQLVWRTAGLPYGVKSRVEEMGVAHSVAAMRTVEVMAAEQGIGSAVRLSTGMLQVAKRRSAVGCGGLKRTGKLGVRANSLGLSGEGGHGSGLCPVVQLLE